MSEQSITCKLEMYKMLRDEVQSCVERDNTLTTFMTTAVATILSVGVSAHFDSSLMYLLPFCLIIPLSDRIRYYKHAIPRITSYMMQLEKQIDINYETDYLSFSDELKSRNVRGIGSFVLPVFKKGSMRNYLGFYLGVLCVGFYAYTICIKYMPNIQLVVVLVALGFISLLLTYRINRETSAKYINERKHEYNQLWDKVLSKP